MLSPSAPRWWRRRRPPARARAHARRRAGDHGSGAGSPRAAARCRVREQAKPPLVCQERIVEKPLGARDRVVDGRADEQQLTRGFERRARRGDCRPAAGRPSDRRRSAGVLPQILQPDAHPLAPDLDVDQLASQTADDARRAERGHDDRLSDGRGSLEGPGGRVGFAAGDVEAVRHRLERGACLRRAARRSRPSTAWPWPRGPRACTSAPALPLTSATIRSTSSRASRKRSLSLLVQTSPEHRLALGELRLARQQRAALLGRRVPFGRDPALLAIPARRAPGRLGPGARRAAILDWSVARAPRQSPAAGMPRRSAISRARLRPGAP